MATTPTQPDAFDCVPLLVQIEAQSAGRDYDRERQDRLDAEAEERESLDRIAEMQRTGAELPVWAIMTLGSGESGR